MQSRKELFIVKWADTPAAEKVHLRLELLVGTIHKHRPPKVVMILTETSLVSPGKL